MQIKPVATEEEWERAVSIRQRVFVEEQACPPEEEWDDYDATSRHFLGLVDGEAVATARWHAAPWDGQVVAKLERFAVLPQYRGVGRGQALVVAVIDDARRAGFRTFVLHAQAHLEHFYERFGFRRTGEVFMEAGIPHVKMVRQDPEPRRARGGGGRTA